MTTHHAPMPPPTPTRAPRHTVDTDAARAHHTSATETGTPAALWAAVADIPVLLAEIDRCRTLLTHTRRQYADLLAAARAAAAAWRDGEADPLWYLRDELTAGGQLPPPGVPVAELLAASDVEDGR